MRLNTKHWLHVKDCDFVVGAKALPVNGGSLQPGEPLPKRLVSQALYELNRIFPVENQIVVETKPTKKSKRKH
jgi:hypothetical protein